MLFVKSSVVWDVWPYSIDNLLRVVEGYSDYPEDGGRKRLRDIGNKLRVNRSSYI